MINPTEHPQWQRARRCGTQACVEVAKDGEQYLIRDSKNPQNEPMRFTKAEWNAFLTGAREGDFDF
jgi:hypothetical protein